MLSKALLGRASVREVQSAAEYVDREYPVTLPQGGRPVSTRAPVVCRMQDTLHSCILHTVGARVGRSNSPEVGRSSTPDRPTPQLTTPDAPEPDQAIMSAAAIGEDDGNDRVLVWPYITVCRSRSCV